MSTMTIPVYYFDGLSDKAKEKARDWFREDWPWGNWYDSTFEDFELICAAIGITIDYRRDRRDRAEPSIFFSGFWSQGDGASFAGRYTYKPDAAKAIRDHAGVDSDLHAIADALQAVQAANGNELSATISAGGHRHSHEYTMSFEIERDSDSGAEIVAGAEAVIIEAMRDLARWLYRQLESEHEELTSNECIDDNITINEYLFSESGSIMPA